MFEKRNNRENQGRDHAQGEGSVERLTAEEGFNEAGSDGLKKRETPEWKRE